MSSLNLALVQFSPIWENIQANLNKLDNLLSNIKPKTDLVLLPEMFNSGFSMNTSKLAENMSGKTNEWLKQKSMQYAIAGTMAIEVNGKFYNRTCVYYKQELIGIYDKRYLFGLGAEDQFYNTGNTLLQLKIKGVKFCFFTCYDLRFPEWIRNTCNYDAAVFLASWPEKRINHWDALLKARAIENQSWVIGVNRTGMDGLEMAHCGHSQVINPLGELTTTLTVNETIIYESIDTKLLLEIRKKLPFLKDIKHD